jgi:NADPH:quinone reductase-like Zn-dependent oxidoreductase
LWSSIAASSERRANTGLFTAYFALVELACLKPNQHVVVTAASSSMGVAALQLIKAIHGKSIAVTRSEAKQEGLLAVGADQVLIAGRENIQEAIFECTEGLGAEVIYDAVGGPGLEELIWATKRFGWVVVYGQLGAMENGTPFPLGACAFRGLKVHASFRVFDFTGPLSWVFQQEPRQLSVRSALFRTAWRRDAFRLRSIGSLSDWANTQRRTATWKRTRGSVRS